VVKVRLWKELKVRKKMVESFKSAGMYLGTIEKPKFPKIHSVKVSDKITEIVFTLPAGLDPKLLKKNEFVFQQKFGKNTVIKGELKHFTLTNYTTSIPSKLIYNYDQYQQSFESLALPIVAGMDLNGNIEVFDMVKNPHLLIAGETGSGKSTQLRSVLSTLIRTLPADQLELYLCDLKRSEFHVFRSVEHVRGLFNSAREMVPMLQYLQKEMQRRGDILDRAEVSHIDDLEKRLPYIILCIDEVALLQTEKRIMALVEEISAIGRALGVFLILSTQRPARQVLDGKLKNNLTVRMGFKCADLINSRIIGTPGSEKLKLEGRMLLKLPKYSEPCEIQAPFLTVEGCKELLEGYRCPKPRNMFRSPEKASEDVIELDESDFQIFEVLDE
jgi:DNA segregation ATPase FtsK/SpoIIIE, S-DNA-T family